MKTTNRKTIVIATLAIITLTAGAAMAQGQGNGKFGQGQGQGQFCKPGGQGQRGERMAQVLELTDEQQTKIQELRDANREKNLELKKELARLHNEFEGEMLKDDVDAKAALKLQQRMGDLRTEMQSNRLETRLAVREQLTPEQRDKMLAMGGKHGKRGGRHGRGVCSPRHAGFGQGGGQRGDGSGRAQCRFDND
ncbi:MAG: periplasmic heavy metal sensor [bacterium]|nr:periplasmic heavy metal sensor [bacterium]